MDKHFGKFIFLGVAIAAVFFARGAFPAVPFNGLAAANISVADQSAAAARDPISPTLVLPSIPASAAVGASAKAGNAPGAASQPTVPAIAASVRAKAFLIADPRTGAIYVSDHADLRWPTASLTKLMTASLAIDGIASSTRITIASATFAVDPDEYTLVDGGTYAMGDLMKAMLMPSSNVAAEAFADDYGEAEFMRMMNARAAQWGMSNTYFDDPSGLSAANQSTAHDLFLLGQKIYGEYPQVLAVTRMPAATITELGSGRNVAVKSINEFAGEPDFIGGKTGHTDEASGNLLSIFEYRGEPVMIIVLGTTDRFGDTQKLYTWFKADGVPTIPTQ